MGKQCIALSKRLLLALLTLTFVSCYTIKKTVIEHLAEKYPSKYWHEQQRIKDSIQKKGHKTVPPNVINMKKN
tara:strand:- start:637 stop:855 length:219 start_codon:yes stop_codon:yes gene_type:complete